MCSIGVERFLFRYLFISALVIALYLFNLDQRLRSPQSILTYLVSYPCSGHERRTKVEYSLRIEKYLTRCKDISKEALNHVRYDPKDIGLHSLGQFWWISNLCC